ncbi:ATP-binding protein [Pararhodospirillum oryzae]|uniref:Serine/threonine protein kinase n=1 Tax=Pararhodospirillum oryzae TaxID=478448 RepID=A0A512H7B8_9PROT|nr:ATP-binding protein [Pararhodospirillum oryzae]GEO81328.1 serine/threonine protein kinase [Pararhodospirillum oryzae]
MTVLRTPPLPAVPVAVRVQDDYDVALARRLAAGLAQALGFSRTKIYRLATAVSELGTNLVMHAQGGGTLHVDHHEDGARSVITVIAEDEGPGIVDLGLALRDGYSTAGGLGGGLPGCRRLMDEFEIASEIGKGTRVVTRLWR